MRTRLRAHAARQGGVFARRQALPAGYSEQEIRRFTGVDGPWGLVRRGAYAERALVESLDPRTGSLELQDRAASLPMNRPHLMSHDSAARSWRLPMLRPELEPVHVTRFGVGGSRTTEGVKHHLTRLGCCRRRRSTGCGSPGWRGRRWTREHGVQTGVMACDVAARRGVVPADFEAELALMWCWPGVTRARAAVELLDPGAESPAETRLRELLLELGIGAPSSQSRCWRAAGCSGRTCGSVATSSSPTASRSSCPPSAAAPPRRIRRRSRGTRRCVRT